MSSGKAKAVSTWGTTKRIVDGSNDRNTKATSSEKVSTSASNSISRNKRVKPPTLTQDNGLNKISHQHSMPIREVKPPSVLALQATDEIPAFLQHKA